MTPSKAPGATATRNRPGDGRRVLLASPCNIEGRAWGGIGFEFLQVISQIESAVVAAPRRRDYSGWPLRLVSDELVPLVDRVREIVRFKLRRPAPRLAAPEEVSGTFDLCFYVCQFGKELGEIDRIRGWRERSKLACAFILETWPQTIGFDRANYRMLDRFDCAFVLNPRAIPLIQAHTKTPVLFLPTAADTLLMPASLLQAERLVDILCIGRKNPAVHAAMLDYSEQQRKLYLYDVWSDMLVRDWAGARRYNAELAARSKFYVVWRPEFRLAPDAPSEQALSNRYFEGAASGAVMIGSRPDVGEFGALFDWPDALIDLPQEPEAVGPFLRCLEADPARLARIRQRNRREALLRHDWVHRWTSVLDALGLERTTAHGGRLATLGCRVETEVAPPMPQAAVRTERWRGMADSGLASLALVLSHAAAMG
jgi:Glycosyl transferases group 1